MPLTTVVLACTLTRSPGESSELLAGQVLDALKAHNVAGESIRVVDHDVKPGVEADMGGGDAWPSIRNKIHAADILVVATPTWMGQHSSTCMRVLGRLDAELSDTDDAGHPHTYGKVAIAAVVGNEDGRARHQRRALPSAERRRLHDPRGRRHVLERRSHAHRRLQGSGPHAGKDRQHHEDPGRQRRTPRATAALQPVPGRVGGRT
jgi:multimeric flavodoxin WrbA